MRAPNTNLQMLGAPGVTGKSAGVSGKARAVQPAVSDICGVVVQGFGW